jgi:hypothetical protein
MKPISLNIKALEDNYSFKNLEMIFLIVFLKIVITNQKLNQSLKRNHYFFVKKNYIN